MKFNYITDTPGTHGRIKQFSEDFMVCEIGMDYETSINYIPDKKVNLNWDEVYEKKDEVKRNLHVDLEKFNLSTTNAIKRIARFLRISNKRIDYAGLKDKRAITSQRICIKNPPKDRISKLNFNNLKIYNPFWSEKEIDIGDLKRNKFIITIRQIENKTNEELKEIVTKTIDEVNKKGIINYFGEQRFGGAREVTHIVGKYLIKRDYKKAVLEYLTHVGPLEREDIKNARIQLKKDLDFSKHAANFPTRTGYESAMLNHLAKKPDDFLGAFKILPKSIQYLFIHAYQSYLFNELINLRIEKGYSINPIEGDDLIDGEIYLPLFGFESNFSKGLAGKLEKEILEKENISFKEFYNLDYSVLSTKGDFRKMLTKVYDPKLEDISDDLKNPDLNNPKKVIVSFALDKGKYATVFLREIIKKEFIG